MDYVKLTHEPLPVEYIYNLVCAPDAGAVSLFIGTTRDNFEGKVVTNLEYEAHEGMAMKGIENICKNVRLKFDVKNIAIYHRLGNVPVKEASVVIAISSAHRQPSLEALPFAINALKADVTIWKKEVYEGSELPQWKENSESSDIPLENIQLYEEVVDAAKSTTIPSNIIQINANLQEINRRINSFINRKRQQVNLGNLQDFCLHRGNPQNEFSCARVDAVLMRRKDSKSHLKVYRVENVVGPQTHGFDPGSKIPDNFSQIPEPGAVHVPIACPKGAEERLFNAEDYLGIKNPSPHIFERLKAIEDKILYLESISPEYFDFGDLNQIFLEQLSQNIDITSKELNSFISRGKKNKKKKQKE